MTSNTNLLGNWYETEVGKNITSKKYFHEGETFDDFVNRVGSIFENKELGQQVAKAIYDADFLPAGRSLYSAGCKGKFKGSMSNCYIIQNIRDDLESIFETCGKMARIFASGGGAGVNISNLRPRGAITRNSARTSTGAVSFMSILDNVGCTIGSNARRAALIIGLNCDHPDIEEFLDIKKNNTAIQSANISILFTDEFMKAVESNSKFELYFKVGATGEEIRKTIDAREFFWKFCEAQWNHAEPGALFIDTIRRNNYMSGYPEDEYRIDISNPCVSGDTLILTKNGYQEIKNLVRKETCVWNGYEWSVVTPKITGKNQKMKLVTLSNGMELKCTNYHKFVMKDNKRKKAEELLVGDKLMKWEFPVVEGNDFIESAYSHGFYSGDGTEKYSQVCLYGDKKELLKYLDCDHSIQQNVQERILVYLKEGNFPYQKDFVPDSTYTIKTRLEWLAGIIDSDGCLNDTGGSISISSVNYNFLKEIQLMLSTTGCHSSIGKMHDSGYRKLPDGNGGEKEYLCQKSYRLTISASNVSELVKLGLVTHRVALIANPNRNASRFISIVKVEDIPDEETVYCFNEEKNHTGIFNGIMTGQCAEYVGSAGNACNLGSINLFNLVKNPNTPQATVDLAKLTELVTLGVNALDEILDYGLDLQPLPENKQAVIDYRAIGLGIFGLADMFTALGVRYGSPKSIEILESVMSLIRDAAVVASCRLAQEKGTFDKYDYKKISKSKMFKELPRQIQNLIKEHGLRNNSILSIAPTGSLATMCGLSSGVEPYYKISYDRTTHALEKEGKFFKVYAKSVEQLLHGEKLTNEQIKERYDYVVDAHDITPEERIAVQAAMQKYVDNAISSTLNMKEESTVSDVFDAYMNAWKSGCKGLTIFRENCARINILGDKHKDEEVTQKFGSIKPIKRSGIKMLEGKTFVGHTACVKNMYTTVNLKDDKVFEVFTNASSGCKSNINTITRLASLALRSGVDVEDVIGELKSNQCPACTTLISQGKNISVSCGSCVGEAIEAMYGKQEETNEHLLPCPECHKNTLKPEGKCFTCSNCGYSKCD